ncbi:GH3 auxin-responsive promoter family protein [Aporhodopirellula aestuarii]|uniref:GH3 auxin-responsive promoter family protein n=1 Tax=Aporhodopirellula aestuarii TaxID=2950107 RepID=A0ABT0TY22_9BACT|nr:GH3 auxin-responsive promoter family protein [Aporhodopirellula aestuarii]MCM2369158.1 GH3 auxin-responsive promoter family protein [Aporhodopirellula aestuarii]
MNARWAYIQLQSLIVKRMMANNARSREIQQRVLQKKIQICADSRFGRDHGLRSIRSVADFRRQIPITDFEYLRPYMDEVRNGNPRAMFGPQTRLLMFAMTSGTTEKPKLIPVTDDFVKSYKRGWKIWGLKAHIDHMDLARKDYVHLAGDWQESRTESGVWCGSISGLAAETRPPVVRRPFIVPPQVGKIGDWTSRQYTTLRLSLPSRRVGMIITANPLTLISLAKLADQHKETLLRDLRDGTITMPADGNISLNPSLKKRIRPVNKRRCDELEQIVERTGHLLPRDFWPELSLVGVWMGGSVGAFVPDVRKLYGSCAFRDHGLSASEGRMTIPMQDESNAGLLDYTSNFYEFIPVAEFGNDDPTILEAHELEEGQSYYILLTNSGGLFRYNIHDVVECVGFEGQTPLLTFLHKGVHCSNMTGEKLTEYQVATAVREAFVDSNRSVETVMLVPVMASVPRYMLLIESQADQGVERLAEAIDTRLSNLNCEYENRLKTKRLLPIMPKTIPTGTWRRLRDKKIADRGGTQEQYKHTFLGSSDAILGELGVGPIASGR